MVVKKKSVFVTLSLSFVLILIVPLFSEGFQYWKMESILEENNNRSNIALLNQIDNVLDGQLYKAHQLAYDIGFNPNLSLLLSYKRPPNLQNNYDYINFLQDLKNYHNFDQSIDFYYIYLPRQDVVLTSTIKTTSESFFHYLYPDAKTGYRTWKNKITGYKKGEAFLPSEKIVKASHLYKKGFTYIQPLPFGSPSPKGYLVEILGGEQIGDMINNMEWANHSDTFVLNKDRLPVIKNTFQGTQPSNKLFQELKGNSGVTEKTINGKKMMVSFVKSSDSGWYVVSIVSKSFFLHKANGVKTMILVSIIVCLLIGCALSYWLAYRHYRPLRELVGAIAKKKQQAWAKGNEFQFLKEALTATWNKEERLEEVIHKHIPEIRGNYFSRLLRGVVDLTDYSNDALRFMNVSFLSDIFAVLIIDIDKEDPIEVEESERQWAAARLTLSSVAREMARHQQHEGYSVEMDQNRIAVLVNFKRHSRTSQTDELRKMTFELKKFLQKELQLYISVGVGNIHHGMNEIRQSYREALMALDYRMIKGLNHITFYSEMETADQYYYYPIEIENQFINVVKTGDFEVADRLLDEVFHSNFDSRHISLELGQCLFFNIMSTFVKILNDLNVDYKQVFQDKPEPVKVLAHCSSINAMYEKIKDYYRLLCYYIAENQKTRSQTLFEEIIGYIQEHYNDHFISLTTIADQFDITPQYLSSFFKKNQGDPLKVYIARLRLKRAKQLLKDDDLTLSRIAEEVGFTNDIALIRLFKKYEGVTPGKYRINMEA
ncbi:putative HTH-type transcriptional regulator YtdP [Pullulanibacillus camelliae]|uniref:Putative HTH-type transcriptional regulator YtdP n=1 Tax=Pullulanibacillus camelliae TaxID=1707096 RepID=A0A8J2YKR8_9BACL|nr:helix-turn-helix domain-containing protein [Pullulanibacillus camelliae]GGE49136.1 putative HTH-type transcriptional regulator YtdP [Pullulanibacillus camelliae]